MLRRENMVPKMSFASSLADVRAGGTARLLPLGAVDEEEDGGGTGSHDFE